MSNMTIGSQNEPVEGQTKTLNINSMPWEDTPWPDIKVKKLFQDDVTGFSTILFKFAPGAKTPKHEHMGLEQVLILEGALRDHEGTYPAGSFVWRIAGSVHQAEAPEGSLHLAFFTKKNRMIEDELRFP